MFYDEKIETLARDELRQVQIERLQSTLNRVYRNVAFYRQRFDVHAVNIESIKSLEALRELPFTTRDDLRDSYPYDMFAVPLREIVRIHSTVGTTGRPVVVGYTKNDVRHWTECTARLLAAAGITAHDVVQIAFSYTLFTGGFGFHQGAEHLGATVIPSSSTTSPRKQITIMRDYKTTALVSTPSYALTLSSALEELGVHPERLHVRVGLFGAQPWSESLRSRLEERLHISAIDSYGLSEIMGPGVAGECQVKQGLHINEDHFIVEVIDPHSLQPVAPGGEGELVFTTLTKEGFPLIRYRTGDVTSLNEEPCECGRTFLRMAKVTGRTDDQIFFEGVGIFPSQIEEILLEIEGTTPHFQIVLDREDGVDTLEIRVEVTERIPAMDEVRILEKLRAAIVKRIKDDLDVPAKVTFVEPRSLDRGRGDQVVDRRQE